MMQSAAVLPTESPVKSLPEILGVPLQRKTFFLNRSSDVLRDYSVGPEGSSGDEETRGDLAGCRAQANNVSISSRKGALSFASCVINLCSIGRLRPGATASTRSHFVRPQKDREVWHSRRQRPV